MLLRLARGSIPASVVAAGVIAVGGGGIGLVLISHSGYTPPPAPPASQVPVPSGIVLGAPAPAATRPVPPPVELTIPAIGVRTRLVRLGRTASGALQVPGSTAVAGWYTGSPPPGAIGSAVIAGHVDSYLGPGVFFWLRDLRPGDRIYVRQADRKLVVFHVTSVRLYRQKRFPTIRVYGPVPDAELRLITCGGTFDPQIGAYLSNVVVYATMSAGPPAG